MPPNCHTLAITTKLQRLTTESGRDTGHLCRSMKIITNIEKREELIYTTEQRQQYIFTATTQTIKIKETRCMNITTHDYYKYIVLLTIVVRAITIL